MYPQNCEDQTTCLDGLVGIKSKCPDSTCAPAFIEDLEGIDLTALAAIAGAQTMSGEEKAQDLIKTAAKFMLADIEMMYTGNYSLIEAFGQSCGDCKFLSGFQAGSGVKVRNLTGSKYSRIVINNIQVNCNATGTQRVVLDDGVVVKKFEFEASGASDVIPLEINYSTLEKSVKITLEDATVGLAILECAAGCGCSGKASTPYVAVSYGGVLLGIDTTTQYGFKVCANVVCSNALLTCDLVKQTPNLFAITLLYKVGELFFRASQTTTRVNRFIHFSRVATKFIRNEDTCIF